MTRKICTTCGGRGKIPNPNKFHYQAMITCPNCQGEGFVGIPDYVNQNQEEICERIAKVIDPDNTFLDECQKLVDWRFGKQNQEGKE